MYFLTVYSSNAERASNMVNRIQDNLANVTERHSRINTSLSNTQQFISDLQDNIDTVCTTIVSCTVCTTVVSYTVLLQY